MDQLNLTKEQLELFANNRQTNLANFYELPEELNDAVEIALALNQPLLITGEPGTGKTLLADKVAADLNLISGNQYHQKPYVFNTKSTSSYNDLFYTYDAITHFYDANIKKDKKPQLKDYIQLNALGMAIVASMEPGEKELVPATNLPGNDVARNSVVLIDEIDKAPGDFPNDLLFELEKYAFRIKENGATEFTKNKNATILIIITSNGEKKLPEAFLRRCIFFNIKFPEKPFLLKILEKHALSDALNGNQSRVLEKFAEVRELCIFKKPSTAELIAWVKILIKNGTSLDDAAALAATLPVLVKDEGDLSIVKQKWGL